MALADWSAELRLIESRENQDALKEEAHNVL